MTLSWTPGGARAAGAHSRRGLTRQGVALRQGMALLAVDLQLAKAPGGCPPAMRESLLGHLDAFRAEGLPIVHALGGRPLTGPFSRGEAADGGWEGLDRAFLPRPDARLYGGFLAAGRIQRLGPGEVALYKPGWGAFYRSPLEAYLRAQGTDTLLVAGCGFPCGPRATLYEAGDRGFATVLLEDAVSGFYALARAEAAGMGVALRRNRRPRRARA